MINSLNQRDVLDRLGLYMSKQKLSAYEISLRLGHSSTYFYRVQSGEIKLTLDVLLKVLEILEVSTEEFFANDIDEYLSNKEKLDVVKNLTKDELSALAIILKNR